MPVFDAVEGSTYRYASARKGGPLTHIGPTREPQILRGMLHCTQTVLLRGSERQSMFGRRQVDARRMPRGQACDANRNKQTTHNKAEQTTAF